MNILASSGLAVFLASIITAIFVYFKDPKRQINIVWGLFCLSVSLWGMGLFFGFITVNKDAALFWGRFLNLAAIFIPVFFLHFVYAFLGILRKRKALFIISYGIMILYFSISLFFPVLFVKDVLPKGPFQFYPDAGLIYYFFPIFYSVLVLLGIVELFRAYITVDGQKRNQINYLFWGMAIGFAGGATTFPYVFNIKIFPFGTWGVIVYVLLVAYAITKHRLMNISVVISRTLAWALTVLFLGSIYTALLMLYRTYISTQIDLLFWGWTIVCGIIVGHNFQKIRLFLQTTADKAFIKGWYDSGKVLRKTASGLGKALTREDIEKTIYPVFQDDIDIAGSRVYFKGDAFLAQENPIVKQILAKRDVVFLEGKTYLPSFSDNELVALFVLGKKRSEDDYTADDLELFRTMAEYAAIALEYIVKPYEEVKTKFEATERKLFEAEKQLERSQRLASLGTLTAGVAHEIRNPLGIIHSTAEELTDKPRNMAELEKFKESIIRNSRRITSIITNMLNLAKTKEKKYTAVDLNEAVDAALQLFTISGVKLVKRPRAGIRINGEMEELKQVMINLVNNALEAMPEGGTLTIKTYEDGNKACLEISDTGKGMPKDEVGKIFDPFYSTRHEGAGLGLSIVYRIIREHGGDIEVKSKVGKGTTFSIKFPGIS